MDDLREEFKSDNQKNVHKLWLGLAVVIVAIVAMAVFQNGTGFNDFVAKLIDSDGYVEVAYRYDDGSQTQFALLGDVLVALSDTKIEVQSYGGKTLFTELCYMQNPSIEVGKNYAVAYDVGGDDFYVLSKDGLVYRGELEAGQLLISASVNQMDYITLTHEKSGYKSTTDAYNSNVDLVYSFNSSRRFAMDGYVSHDGTTLIEVTLSSSDGAYATELLYYPITDTTLSHSALVPELLPLEVTQKNDTLLLLGDTGLAYVSMDGTLEAEYGFGSYYLRNFDCSGDVFSAVLLNRYQAGNEAQLKTIDHSGQELGSLDIYEEVMDISVSGNYLAVLYSTSLVIYTPDLLPFATVGGLDYASQVIMQSDGSAVVFARDRAEIISP